MMKKRTSLLKRALCTAASCLVLLTGSMAASAQTLDNSTNKSAFVYYVSNGVLYRGKADGTTKAQKLLNSFTGVELTPVQNYLYYMYDEKSTTLLRIPMDGSAKIPSRFVDDEIISYTSDGDYIYYMNAKGVIYRALGNAKKSTEATMVTDMADVKHKDFTVVNGRVYYNALKSGRITTVASKAVDGSGQVQWIAEGDIESIHADDDAVNVIVNTKPTEVQYSTNCMVVYSIPKKGGDVKAANAASPIDANAVYSGWWTDGYYLYNKDIKYGTDDFNYKTGNGYVIDMSGNTIQLDNTGVNEVAKVSKDKLAFVNGNGKAYVSTLSGAKVTDKKELAISDVWAVRNLLSNNGAKSTVFFAESGAYILQSDLSLKKMIGIEWDLCQWEEGVPGFFFINAGDNSRLYYMNGDGSTSTKVSDEKVSKIVLISKN